MSSVVLQVRNVTKAFNDVTVLRNINLSVNIGETLVIIGASGSGKSTLIRCINQLEKIDKGNIIINDKSLVKEYKKGIPIYQDKKVLKEINLSCGMVFQNFNLFPHLSIKGNITIPLMNVLKMSEDESNKVAFDLLNKMGLGGLENRYPCNLSGGQQQRASIARTLAIKPKILFMDEPTSALDPELTGEVLKTIKQLHKEKVTMVIVTHEIGFAKQIADKVIFMDKGEIIEEGTPSKVIDNPQNDRTIEFLKQYKEQFNKQ